ncbi:MAG TPA: hypothetical protein EYP72_00170 [Rhodospirillales bacterium]|nr:hypothetical protein [Rhodospirillales bacterium]
MKIIITLLPGMVTPMDLAPQVAQAFPTMPILLALMAVVSLFMKASNGWSVSITIVPEYGVVFSARTGKASIAIRQLRKAMRLIIPPKD